MNYKETLDWMFAQLQVYQNHGVSAYEGSLTNIIHLTTYLGNPETKFKSIHVAGTNGKGSTSHMLASVLQESGFTVGLYTSPHLTDFRERIRVNGKKISKDYVIDFIANNRPYIQNNKLSFFEMTVGMAFQYFANCKIDIAVIEVGLGGRLDSTNIIFPEVSVITNIGIDHVKILGNTLSDIALEKAGIIKKNTPVVIGKTTIETEKIFKEKALASNSDLYLATNYNQELYPTDLKGEYQKENIKTVLQTIQVLCKIGWRIDDSSVKRGMNSVVTNTGLLGRWQVLQENPKVICDVAHNEDGLIQVMNQLLREKYDKLHVVLGVVKEKNLDKILHLFPKNAMYYFSKPAIYRGLDAIDLQKSAKKFGLIGECYDSVVEAYQAAIQCATEKDVIYVGGSTFVVAEIL